MMYCVKPLLKTINQAFSDHCHMCTVPCNSTQYNVQLSYTTIPNNNIEAAFATKYNLPTGSNYIKDNIVALDIYYEELNLETMEQKKAVEESGLLSDIGGQLGLFMGFSALTFLEFFEYIILKFRRITQRKKRIKPLA
ncbi:acid-sensing ion channel 1B-like [Lingula anatina]|uniref:Acid-sensing ion channel 1B-like n=1 Tax=Lingula anatina TaxID=7574 RepID=A0A1S3IEB1_LINAN|nr:acid-sensing ion channel 1B-like [Lingula anatina]|eukprot:XP_013396196.1 acid-sensing ion channel 1B-like [Lingula anatina]